MPNPSKTRPYHLSADRARTVLAQTARGLDMARFRDAVAFGADNGGRRLISDLRALCGQGVVVLSGGYVGDEWRGRAWVRLPDQPEPTREDLETEAKR